MYEKAGMKVMESEWKTLKPKDKELRSYLRWRWAKEGYDWDPATGVAIERSSEIGGCDRGMGCLTINDSKGDRRQEQVRISDSKTSEVRYLEELPISFGCVLKVKGVEEPAVCLLNSSP